MLTDNLPTTRNIIDERPVAPVGGSVEFRLTYQGRIPAAGRDTPRTKDKHAIRRVMHPQLRQLWQEHPGLSEFYKNRHLMDEHLANNYARFGYRFVPLICKEIVSTCALDILFLRRDAPGSLVKHGGDIDNRIKVLFDGLRLPESKDEANNEAPGIDEDPFFVLLQDDKMITELRVTTDRLLTPLRDGESEHDVHMVIRVETFGIGKTMV